MIVDKIPFPGSCPEFGSSGSGVVRAWAKREDKRSFSIDGLDLTYPYYDYNYNYNYYYDYYYGKRQGHEDYEDKRNHNEVFPIEYQYSFVGPLSMQKGCDNAFHMYTKAIDSNRNKPPNNGIDYEANKLSYRGIHDFLKYNIKSQYFSGENPLVFTDARCFMPWIASQYNMKLEKDYEERVNCKKGAGKRSNINQKRC